MYAVGWLGLDFRVLGRDLGDTYATNNPDQARADALMDLLLTNVTVTAHLTLGIPILTDLPPRPRRHRHLDLTHRHHTHHRTRPHRPTPTNTGPGIDTLTRASADGSGTPAVLTGQSGGRRRSWLLMPHTSKARERHGRTQ